MISGNNMKTTKYNVRVFLFVCFLRPTVLQKDNKLFTYRRLCVMGSLALVSWTTCGALAVFVIYLQYLFKVLKSYAFQIRT